MHQTGHNPVLGFGDRTTFGDFNHVTRLVLALFVMSVVLAGQRHNLAVQLVLDAAFDQRTLWHHLFNLLEELAFAGFLQTELEAKGCLSVTRSIAFVFRRVH